VALQLPVESFLLLLQRTVPMQLAPSPHTRETGIEAQGIRDFQQIVAQGISTQLLEWKGIEATENLAKSSNSKVVVIGNNKNGLPLILGQ